LKHPLLLDKPGLPIFPDSTSWGGDLDTYWIVEERQGTLEVSNTNWKELTTSIAQDLDIDIPTSKHPAVPFCVPVPNNISWAKFPLFPISEASYQAHRLLAILYSEQAIFDNETHPKNESSDYHRLSGTGAGEINHWGARLRGWLINVQLRCANEHRQQPLLERNASPVRCDGSTTGSLDSPATSKVVGDPAPEGDEAQSGFSQQILRIENSMGAVEKPEGKWTVRVMSVIVFTVLCLFIVAVANIIAGFPWLSVLIGLPCALYLKFRKGGL
jgi:hypothetical protein